MDAAFEAQDPLIALVHMALASDDPGRLVAAAEPELRRPLGLVDATGQVLGHAPDSDAGRQALAIARAAAISRLVAPPGWRIMPIARASSALGFLAVGGGATSQERLLDLVAELLADQLQRRLLLQAQTTAFVQRLVRAPAVGAPHARRDAAELGLVLAESYWPAILAWRGTAPRAEVIECVAGEARGSAEGSLAAVLDGRMVLLHPAGDRNDRGRIHHWLEQIIGRARRVAPSSRPQAIAAEGSVGLGELSARVSELEGLSQLGPRAEEEKHPVVNARDFALDRLLQRNADTGEARDLVEHQLGRLIAWDHEHRTDLLTVLEAALDYPRHDVAAARCFMHRNTFRHRYKQATEILDHGLEDPDARLALHVALKLRKVLARPAGHGLAEPRRAPRAAERQRAPASRR
jgi:sugar diacid utilization regulator